MILRGFWSVAFNIVDKLQYLYLGYIYYFVATFDDLDNGHLQFYENFEAEFKIGLFDNIARILSVNLNFNFCQVGFKMFINAPKWVFVLWGAKTERVCT